MAGRALDHFAEQFPVLEPTKPPAVISQPRCLSSHEWNHKSIVSFFQKVEKVTIERHRSRVPVDKKTKKTQEYSNLKNIRQIFQVTSFTRYMGLKVLKLGKF